MEVDLTPEEVGYWIHREMQTNKKHTKHTILWLLSVIAKMKQSAGADLGAGPCSDISRYDLGPPASKPPPKGKIMQGQQKVLLRSLVTR